jgi:hypothetical protein
VALAMDVLPDGDSVYGSTYRAADNRWSSAALLDGASGFTWGAAIDEAQRAVVTWGFTGDYGWSRLTSQGSWVNAGALGYTASVTVTPAGMATALVYDGGSNSYITQTLNLSNGAVDPVVPTGISGPFAGPFLVASLERVALVWARGATNGQELVVAWKGASDWSTPEPLAATVDIRTLVVDADEQGNIMLVWNDVNEVWSRTYQRGTDEWTRTQFVAATTTEAIIHPLDVTRGNAILAVDSRDTTEGTWAAIYEAGTGWIDSSIVSLDDPPDGQDIAVSIDAAGNALAVWQSELRFQRYVAGVGWQTPSSLQARVDPVYVWSAAAPDGSVLVVANDLEDSPSVYPMAIRFE